MRRCTHTLKSWCDGLKETKWEFILRILQAMNSHFFHFIFFLPKKKIISLCTYTQENHNEAIFSTVKLLSIFFFYFYKWMNVYEFFRAKAESFEQIIKKAKENKIIVSIPLEPFIAYMRFKLFLHRSIPTSDCDLTTMTTTRSLWSVTKDLLW